MPFIQTWYETVDTVTHISTCYSIQWDKDILCYSVSQNQDP